LGSLLCNIFINDLSNAINCSMYLLFANDITVLHGIKSASDCSLLRSGIDSVQCWCTANFMKLNISKTSAVYFSRKNYTLVYHYKLCQSSITHTDSVKDLRYRFLNVY
jgi:hypothetical protein